MKGIGLVLFFLIAYCNLQCSNTAVSTQGSDSVDIITCDTARIGRMETLFVTYLGKNKSHPFTLMQNQRHGCLDSAFTIREAKRYIAELKEDSPVAFLDIFNSQEGFDSGENLSQPESFWKHRVIRIAFNGKGEPDKFTFYDDQGKKCYESSIWKK